MQYKWVTWSLKMFRCILSQFISLWDYWIAYLQQKYGHSSRMSSSSGRVEDSVQYRSLGQRVEAGSGVRGYSRYAHPGCLLLGGGAQLGALHLAQNAQLDQVRSGRGRVCRRDLLPAPWRVTHCVCALVWQGLDLLTLAACSGLSSESTTLELSSVSPHFVPGDLGQWYECPPPLCARTLIQARGSNWH